MQPLSAKYYIEPSRFEIDKEKIFIAPGNAFATFPRLRCPPVLRPTTAETSVLKMC
jgi:hypothetical protein